MMVAEYEMSFHQHHRWPLLWEDTGGKGVGAEKSSTSLIQSKRGKERKNTGVMSSDGDLKCLVCYFIHK